MVWNVFDTVDESLKPPLGWNGDNWPYLRTSQSANSWRTQGKKHLGLLALGGFFLRDFGGGRRSYEIDRSIAILVVCACRF